ncbi:MAG: dTDP-glucose 4,6-dehydratase [Flavobacteriaceae bacterium]|nr:MAG: dTDP-glucose 4,6-dehydratase [Flavobacteriaceae bacterium]
MTILITGGAGFIGSHLVRHLVKTYPHYTIVNLDALTYAANLARLDDVKNAPNYQFVKGNINDSSVVENVFQSHSIDAVIHLAAESHVDRSIEGPMPFAKTNIIGTMTLLNACRTHWKKESNHRFYHISTDEVYGSLGKEGVFTEQSPYQPRSPYAASKASADHMVRAYGETYGLPYVISNCSNNYGPDQHSEKLIPTLIHSLQQNKALPIYGDGSNIRDWLYVEDHISAMDLIFHKGDLGETYLIGGRCEQSNLAVATSICRAYDTHIGQADGTAEKLITFVPDRPGHDYRYAIDPHKLESTLGWSPQTNWEVGIQKTISSYLDKI